uniref:Toxin candidate TRINITY_DN13476_c0_g1_i1 n=1 Tax=Pachycerianthus borealis TaxID=2736680 RepID=A0A7G7WYX8_9CNID|nr:toxin candidate TRINITY_DN13476_c0_g1_i1 [Pachycerianthus borealis]
MKTFFLVLSLVYLCSRPASTECQPDQLETCTCSMYKDAGFCTGTYANYMATNCDTTCNCQVIIPDEETVYTESVDSASCLGSHNNKRALHSTTPSLTWSSSIASAAETYALEMATNGVFQHSGSSYGENLYWKQSTVAGTCENAVDSWYSEEQYYDYSTGTQKSGYESEAIGHFTQVVWKSTSEVGVGIAIKKTTTKNGCQIYYETYIVGQYNPSGNWGGQYTTNVMEKQ